MKRSRVTPRLAAGRQSTKGSIPETPGLGISLTDPEKHDARAGSFACRFARYAPRP